MNGPYIHSTGLSARRLGQLAFTLVLVLIPSLSFVACDINPTPPGPRGRPTPTPLGTLGLIIVDEGDSTPVPGVTITRRPIQPSRTLTRVPTNTPTPTKTPGTPLPTATPTITLTPFATPTRFPTPTTLLGPPTVTPRGAGTTPTPTATDTPLPLPTYAFEPTHVLPTLQPGQTPVSTLVIPTALPRR